MSLVTYASTHGEATGIVPRDTGGEIIFHDAPASLFISYTYDAGLVGVDGTFAVPDLTVKVNVPGYYHATARPGTIEWAGSTIRFDAVSAVAPGYPPDVTIDVTFAAGGLTPGLLPSSLAGLEGIPGAFHAHTYGTLNTRSGGDVYGTVVSAPEPASAVLLALGLISFLIGRLARRQLERIGQRDSRAVPVRPSPTPRGLAC